MAPVGQPPPHLHKIAAHPGLTRLHRHPGHDGNNYEGKHGPRAAKIQPHFEPGALIRTIGIRADAAVDAHGLAAFGAVFRKIGRGGHGGTSLVLGDEPQYSAMRPGDATAPYPDNFTAPSSAASAGQVPRLQRGIHPRNPGLDERYPLGMR